MLVHFFITASATTEIYTLSLHDALPILDAGGRVVGARRGAPALSTGAIAAVRRRRAVRLDRKSTRLNSSHLVISYAVFCLKKKKRQVYRLEILQKIIYIGISLHGIHIVT